jgi:hypothetical protein
VPREARLACDKTKTLDLSHVGIASTELAEVLLRQGDLSGAEAALRRAREYGASVEPSLALLRLERGEIEGARSGLEIALTEAGARPLARARLLPAWVEVTLSAGDEVAAGKAAAELVETAATYATPALQAAAEQARGLIELRSGAPEQAAAAFEYARRLWRRVDAPYEEAQARALLAQVHAVLGDRESALLELHAAWTAFEGLGASLAAAACKESEAELA